MPGVMLNFMQDLFGKHALNKVKGYGRGECFVMKVNKYKVFLVDHCTGGVDLYSVRGSWDEM